MPVDCDVFQGSATITIEHLTGEIKPIEAKVGDRIPGGARNLDGRIIVKVCNQFAHDLELALKGAVNVLDSPMLISSEVF